MKTIADDYSLTLYEIDNKSSCGHDSLLISKSFLDVQANDGRKRSQLQISGQANALHFTFEV